MKKMINIVLLGMLIIIFAGCGSNGDDSSVSSVKSFKTFSINGVAGTINETAKTIAVIMPPGTSVTNLAASFTTTGSKVVVNGTEQTSGTTSNDFTSPVIYAVTADDDSTQDYTVTVTIATKSITTFSISGADGTINETAKTIAVIVPPDTDMTSLVATFTANGSRVEVNGIEQLSGATVNDFASPVMYTVIAVDNTTQNYTVTVTERQPATAISVSMTPNNEGTSVPTGVYCTRTASIIGSQIVTPDDGNTLIYWEFLVDNTSRKSGTNTLAELRKQPARLFPPFGTGTTVTYRATADGNVSNSTSAKVTCGRKYN